jgi:hypothetical protein
MSGSGRVDAGEFFDEIGKPILARQIVLCCTVQYRIKQMSAEQLKSFADRDYLDLLYLHIYSLSGLDKLIERSKVVGNGLQYPRVRVDDLAQV